MIYILCAFVAGCCFGGGVVGLLAVREERAADWRVARPLGWRVRRWFR